MAWFPGFSQRSNLPTRITVPLRRILALLACLVGIAALPAPAAAQPFETGIFDHIEFAGADRDIAFNHVRAAGGITVRIGVAWSSIAPYTVMPDGSIVKPKGFDPRDPRDPMYDFSLLDQQVISATSHGLTPILTLFHAPSWAERGSEGFPGARDPDPNEFGYFAEAVAKRYSGEIGGLPQVTRFQGWSEPNLYRYVVPQYDSPLSEPPPPDAKPLSPGLYRKLLVQFEKAIHGVSEDNLVITAGLAPFKLAYPNVHAVAPLRFLRELFCMTDENKPKESCGRPLRFDVISTHPYTEGGPNHQATDPENVSMGDLPEWRALIDAGIGAGRVVSDRKIQFWITEFSWDTSPPDEQGVPLAQHARWAAEAFYRMWQNGVSLVTWFKIRDEPVMGADGMHYESGLYFMCDDGIRCDKPKPVFRAFRFPFVAFPSGRKVRVWGRTPAGVPAEVKIEQRKNGRWRPLGELNTDIYGIFRDRLKRKGEGVVRARTRIGSSKERSLPFEPKPTEDQFFLIFGS